MKSIWNNKPFPDFDQFIPPSTPKSGRLTGIPPLLPGVLGLVMLVGWLVFQPVIPFDYVRYVNLSAHFFYVVPPVFISVCVLYLVAAGVPLKIGRIDLLLVVYAGYIVINYSVRDLPYSENLVNFTLIIFAVLFIRQLYNQPRWGTWIQYGCFFLLFLFGLFEVVYGELQLLGVRPSHHRLFRLTGTFHNPGPYAIFLSPVFIVALAVVLFPPKHSVLSKPLIGLCWGVVCGIAVILPATNSRSAWVGTLVGASLAVGVKNQVKLAELYARTPGWQRLIAGGAGLAGVLVGAYLLYQYKPDSTVGRALVWRISLQLLRENALFGVGFEQFRAQFGSLQSAFVEQYSDNLTVLKRADYIPYVLNDYLQIVVENGLVGLGLFTMMVMSALRTGFKKRHIPSFVVIGSTAALLALLIAGFFSYPFEVPSIWVVFLFLISVLSHQSKEPVMQTTARHPFVQLIAVATVVSLTLVLRNQIRIIKAQNDWQRARYLLSSQSFQQGALAYQAAFRESPDRPEVLLGYGKALYMNGQFAQSARILEKASTRTSDPVLYMNLGNAYAKLTEYAKAEQAYKKACSIIPNRLYPRYLLAKLYQATGNREMARQTARYVLDMPVSVSSPASRQILTEMKKLLDTD
ncbi:O-antigen ligase family protein [Larkinella bovis]|uniref:O-antigen ligase family protein n=1 Tax=Larkinella bovis TaxID=683041 RepID=A0ABW0I9W6_9BACT